MKEKIAGVVGIFMLALTLWHAPLEAQQNHDTQAATRFTMREEG